MESAAPNSVHSDLEHHVASGRLTSMVQKLISTPKAGVLRMRAIVLDQPNGTLENIGLIVEREGAILPPEN